MVIIQGGAMLTINEAAKLLGMPKATVMRWVRQGKLPTREIGGQTLFSQEELVRWARKRNIFLHRDVEPAGKEQRSGPESLYRAVEKGGVFFNVKGNTPTEVLRRSAQLVPLSPEIDKSFIADLLIQREKLASTGIGKGVAIPHPRYPLESLPVPALITTCFLAKPVDFKAIDGKPVFVLFVLLSSNTKLHLHYLSRLSFCLREPEFVSMLSRCKDPQQLLEAIREKEAAID